jgi:cell division transport system permease protein
VRSWLRQHRRALLAALGKLAAQKASGGISALVIGVALSLPAGGYALLEGLSSLASGVALEPQMSIYLKPDSSKDDAAALAARLKSDARIGRVRFVPRDQALKELKATEGLADVVEALDHNPLPDAFVILARDSSPATLAALAAELRRAPSVAHVQADAVWARRLASLARLGRLAVILLAALLAFGLVAVTFNTIRLQILTQRDEIEVSKLIGATDAFIRRPFLYLGLLQGLAGGALALGIVWSGLALLNVEVRTLAQTYGSSFRFDFLSRGDALAVLLFAGALGWLGASLSVSRYLLEIQPK